jgi:hypothetical protein
VSREAAQILGDAHKARQIGRLVSDLLRPASPAADPLAALITGVKAEARADGLTDEAVDAELALYNAERRI